MYRNTFKKGLAFTMAIHYCKHTQLTGCGKIHEILTSKESIQVQR
jgi:hypothetical protein